MEIFKIVFTGGPCAGKTKLIEKTRDYLLNKNYNVIVVPETATILLESGFNSDSLGDSTMFQEFIFKMQFFNEKLADKATRVNKEKNFIILYDRGVLDNKAYCYDYKVFDKIINNSKKSEINILDNYNLVFDLISTAVCAPEKYNLLTNKQRKETIEEAIKIDQKTSNAWAGHRNLKIINSNISLDEAFELIKKEIDDNLKNETTKEIKSYYINNNLNDFSKYNDNNTRLIKIQEISLISPKKNINYNLYKRKYKNDFSYIFKIFKKENNIITTYLDQKISFETYLELIEKYRIKDITFYNQLSLIKNRQLFEFKFYDDYSVLEYEENKLNDELFLPDNINNNNNEELLKIKKRDNIDKRW